MSRRQKFIRASEIGEYIFCARAWRLRIDGHAPTSGSERREAGERWHRKHGEAVLHVRRLRRLASYSVLLAIVLGVLTLLVWWSR
jgi:CRISPR/Cas system-associated exonuclease Cas4 (RecB family)